MRVDYDKDQLAYALANALKERDEWAAMCGRYKQERDIAEADATNYYARIIELIDERDKTKQERDEAREEWGKASMDAGQLLSEKTKVMAERDEARESLENARELNKWLTVFLEHIRDNADIRYGKHRGLLAFSDLREEASRKWKEETK